MKYGQILQFILILSLTSISLAQEFNEIDASTSASRRYAIRGGKAYTDSAQVTCWGRFRNGQMFLRWGITPQATQDTVETRVGLLPSQLTVSLPNLLPATQYYYSFYGNWRGRQYPNLVTGSFMTPAAVDIKHSLKGKNINYQLTNNQINIQTTSQLKEISVYSIQGKEISRFQVKGKSVISLKNLSKGFYVLRFLTSQKNYTTVNFTKM